ncbi:MAG: transcriptional repressor [Oscillospiraceae bacterium]|jgi:Fur family ferric uptake transcriptional regulator/Fur family peroxide stress response transcriptional regulator|nr:transcriptional repressor [Oscillospiraceae bacterium]
MIRRNTIQCALVFETLSKLKSHATADEIYDALIKEHPNISRGTVYRNLQRLCETGDVRKREIPGGADRFDHVCSNHYHASCLKCGRVFDVDMDYIADINKYIKDTHGFEFAEHDIVFKGICLECKSNP